MIHWYSLFNDPGILRKMSWSLVKLHVYEPWIIHSLRFVIYSSFKSFKWIRQKGTSVTFFRVIIRNNVDISESARDASFGWARRESGQGVVPDVPAVAAVVVAERGGRDGGRAAHERGRDGKHRMYSRIALSCRSFHAALHFVLIYCIWIHLLIISFYFTRFVGFKGSGDCKHFITRSIHYKQLFTGMWCVH